MKALLLFAFTSAYFDALLPDSVRVGFFGVSGIILEWRLLDFEETVTVSVASITALWRGVERGVERLGRDAGEGGAGGGTDPGGKKD